jgi:hypothetical protein
VKPLKSAPDHTSIAATPDADQPAGTEGPDDTQKTLDATWGPFPGLLADAMLLDQMSIAGIPGQKESSRILAKAAIINAAIAVECAASSCVLRIPGMSATVSKRLEKLPTFEKYDLVHGFSRKGPVNFENPHFKKMKELVQLRDDLVHPKPKSKSAAFVTERDQKTALGKLEPVQGRLKELDIPRDPSTWTSDDSKSVIKAVVEFMNYYFLDACGLHPALVSQALCYTSGGDAMVMWATPGVDTGIFRESPGRYDVSVEFLIFDGWVPRPEPEVKEGDVKMAPPQKLTVLGADDNMVMYAIGDVVPGQIPRGNSMPIARWRAIK